MINSLRYFLLHFQFAYFIISLPTDKGLISYFENSCPPGWEENKETACRTFLGPGSTIDAQGESRTGNLLETGGEFNHQLVVNEIPPHTHTFTADGRHGRDPQTAATIYCDWGDVGHPPRTLTSAKTGADKPHNNMPPFIVMKSCRKIEDFYIQVNTSDYISKAQIGELSVSSDFSTINTTLDGMRTNYLPKNQVLNFSAFVKKSVMSAQSEFIKRTSLNSYLLVSQFNEIESMLERIFINYVKKSELTTKFSEYLTKQELPLMEQYLKKDRSTTIVTDSESL